MKRDRHEFGSRPILVRRGSCKAIHILSKEWTTWSSGEYTVGTIPRYGVVIGMTSAADGGETVLWKPNS